MSVDVVQFEDLLDPSLVECVARAIQAAERDPPLVAEEDYWKDECTGCFVYRRMARAALAAFMAWQGRN